jgi:hypothetical protein
MRIRPARFLPAVDGLPGGRTAMIAGGFTSLDFTPSNAVERYDEQKLVVTTLPVGGADRVLREPRGGVTATSLGDGTVLFAGGLTTGALVRQTAEVYADISTPPQAAPLE